MTNENSSTNSSVWQLPITGKMHGLTQLQLAEECDLSRTHISNLEAPNMPTSISLEALFDIADVLEVPIKCFFDFPDASGK